MEILIGLLLIAALCVWLWPLTGVLVLLPVAIALVMRRRSLRDQPPLFLGILALASGTAVAFQIVEYGRPVMWWLVGCLGAQLAIALVCRWFPDEESLGHKMLSSVAATVWSATGGIALVVATQVVLTYRTDADPEEVKAGLRALQGLRAWLEPLVVLGPLRLGAVLVALVAVTAIFPSLSVVRGYRRLARVSSLALLCLTAATSFTFFTAKHSPQWEGAWVAQRGRQLDDELAALDVDQQETVKLAALEDALRSLPDASRAELAALAQQIDRYPAGETLAVRGERERKELDAAIEQRAQEIERHEKQEATGDAMRARFESQGWHVLETPRLSRYPWHRASSVEDGSRSSASDVDSVDRATMWKRVTDDLGAQLSVAPIENRVSQVVAQLEHSPQDPAEASRDQAIERLRRARHDPSSSEAVLDDLEVLGVERGRAQAVKQEAYQSVAQLVLGSLIAHNELATAFLDSFLARVKLGPDMLIRRFVDRRRAIEALRSPARQPPPVWHPDISQALGIAAGALRTDPSQALDGVARRVMTARVEAAERRSKEIEQRARDTVRWRQEEAERWRRAAEELRKPEWQRDLERRQLERREGRREIRIP